MSIFDRDMSIETLKNGRGILKVPDGFTELSGDFALVFDWMPEKSCQYSFREIQLPSSIQKINGIFLTEYGPDEAPIKRFKRITVSEDNQYFTDIDGVLFSKDLTQLICYPCGKTGQTYIVPDSVEIICEFAFADNVNLKKVVLPNSLKRIEYQAFFQCENLSDINLPYGLEYIGEECFGLTTNLNRLIVPITVKQIPTSLFYEGGIVSVPNNKIELKYDFVPTEYLNMPFAGPAILSNQNDELVDFAKTYDYNHFEDCYGDKEGIIWANQGKTLVCFPVEWSCEEYELPDKVREVYIGAFRGCSLKRFRSHNKIVIVGRTTDTPRYFEPMSGFNFHITASEIYCDDSKDENSDILEEKEAKNICADKNGHVVIPDYIKKIGAYAFNCRKDIVSVTLPNGLTAIEESAFNACHNLTEINIPQSVISIGEDAFARCFKLSSITLPEGIESINSGTFQHCSNLKEIIVPLTLKSIDKIAFLYCHKLKEISLTDTVNYIFDDAFEGCIALSIIAPAGSYAQNYAEKHGYITNKSEIKMDSSVNIEESSSSRYAFISYSTKNQQMADSFRALFNRKEIKTWMAPGDIPFGSTYTSTINRAIKEASCFVLLLSESAQGSKWVPKETERAVSYGKTIFTILLDDVPMNDDFEFMLSTSQAVAIRKIDENDEKIQRLIKNIRTYLYDETYTKEKDTIENNPNSKNVFFKLDFSTESGGSIFIYSSDHYDENDKMVFEFTDTMWRQFVHLCKNLIVSCFPDVLYDHISIKRTSKLGIYECAPDNGHSYYDSKYRIDFDISYINSNKNDLYESARFTVDKSFEVTFFKNGNYVFKTVPEYIDLSYFGINVDELRSNSIEMLKFTNNNNDIVISDNFRKTVYSDGSGGFFLDYIAKEPEISQESDVNLDEPLFLRLQCPSCNNFVYIEPKKDQRIDNTGIVFACCPECGQDIEIGKVCT